MAEKIKASSNLMAVRLREVADVLESIGIECSTIAIGGVSIQVDENAFFRLFEGCAFSGNRRFGSSFISISGERHGIIWTTSVYRPVKPPTETASELVEIPASEKTTEPTFAIDGE